jgi:hypothetical protein
VEPRHAIVLQLHGKDYDTLDFERLVEATLVYYAVIMILKRSKQVMKDMTLLPNLLLPDQRSILNDI